MIMLKKCLTLEERFLINNPLNLYSVIFPYTVKFTIPDDDYNTEITINTKTEEFFTAKNEGEVLYHKELSDKYSKQAFAKHIKRYVLKQLTELNPEDGELTYTGTPEVTELSGERLDTFSRELVDLG